MRARPRRPWRYVASKFPNFNDPEEKWVASLKIDRNDPAAMMALRKWLWIQTHRRSASDK